jgi:ATP-binding cassette subfamily F protein 3
MIILRNACLSFGGQTIFNNISCSINQNQRIGLVGRNGSGKSTLLKYLAGQTSIDSGTVVQAKNKTIAYLPQDMVLNSSQTILEETLSAFEEMQQLQKEAHKLEIILQDSVQTDSAVIDRYADICEQLASYNPDKICAQAKKILTGLGFYQEQFNQRVDHLSVGWKMRVVLAKLLLKNADFYLFDEPTNHLDIVAKDWFLNFLSHASFGFMIVCHERYLLDKLTDHTLELEMGNGTLFSGNFSTYEKEKEHRLEILKKAHKQQQDEIDRKMKTIDRFKAKASKAGMAQSMLKKVEKIDLITLPPELKKMHLSFPPVQRSARSVLQVKNVSHIFDQRCIFKLVDFQIEREQKIALVAANGVGKTTLFNLIAKKIALQNGSIELGEQVKTALFDQDQTKALNLNRTIIDNLEDQCPSESRPKVRSFLGAFLFSGDTVHKKVGVLSGGEKNRVGMINVLLKNANFLLLDEPTNHLDIPSKEILLSALQAYPGTIFFVSHDHDFINNLATHVIELHANGTRMYQGNYQDYLLQKELSHTTPSPTTPTETAKKKISHKNGTSAEVTNIKQLERTIVTLEKEISEIGQSFLYLTYDDPEFIPAQKALKEKQRALDKAQSEWEKLAEKV